MKLTWVLPRIESSKFFLERTIWKLFLEKSENVGNSGSLLVGVLSIVALLGASLCWIQLLLDLFVGCCNTFRRHVVWKNLSGFGKILFFWRYFNNAILTPALDLKHVRMCADVHFSCTCVRTQKTNHCGRGKGRNRENNFREAYHIPWNSQNLLSAKKPGHTVLCDYIRVTITL